MTLKEALIVLESNETMDFSSIRRAYRDLVDVWHPDRYTHNHRLQEKANEKLKEINAAYSFVQKYYKGKTNSKNQESQTTNDHNRERHQNRHTEKESVIITCVNCGAKNRITSKNVKRSSVKCGKCRNNPYVKEKAYESESEQSYNSTNKSQSDKRDYILVNCINCGTSNHVLKTDSYSNSIKCSKCGDSLYLKARKTNYYNANKSKTSNLSDELDDIIRKNFEGLKNSNTKTQDPKNNHRDSQKHDKDSIFTNDNFNPYQASNTRYNVKNGVSFGSGALIAALFIPVIIAVSVVILIMSLVISE